MNEARLRPVFYMDIDDTLLRHVEGEGPRPAPGAADFVAWAFDHFEVRWLTRWCRDGRMSEDLVAAFCKMFGVAADVVRRVRGLDWSGTDSKLNGIAWLEHVALGRPFLWIEDEWGLGEAEQDFLRRAGFDGMWLGCNVTIDPDALRALHLRLASDESGDVAAIVSVADAEE